MGDIAFTSTVVFRNNLLFKAYVDADPRVYSLIMIIKRWAKCRHLDEAYLGVINSYTHVLLLLYFLQRRYVLPPLQRICCTTHIPKLHHKPPNYEDVLMPDRLCLSCSKPLPSVIFDGYETYFYEHGGFLQQRHKDPIGKILVKFFYFWAFAFNAETDIVSPRLGRPIPRNQHSEWNMEKSDLPLCVEDPFIFDRNCATSLDAHAYQGLRWEWERAWRILTGQNCPKSGTMQIRLDRLFSPYEPWHPIHFDELHVYETDREETL